MRKNLLFIVIVISIALAVFLFLTYGVKEFINLLSYFQKSNLYKDNIVLFYSSGCQHCIKVDNFIKDNKIEDKVKFTRLEVSNNSVNANILVDKAQICGLDNRQIGVPFLWDGKNCIIGGVDVIKFFQDKISSQKP